MRITALILSVVLFYACGKSRVDLVVHNARIYTVDDSFSVAAAMAVHEGKIVAVGSNEDILDTYEGKETVDASGKTIYPGFIDAHAHFVGYGKGLFEVDLFGCQSWSEVLRRVKLFADAHPELFWIRGRGWDQNRFPGKQFPVNDSLNMLFPDRPVMLTRVDGHAAIANRKALELAGIQPGQRVTGGEIETKNGRLTGVLIDNAEALVENIIPKPGKADYEKWLMAAQQQCFAQGLTTITDCGIHHNEVAIIDELQQQGKLLMRLYVMLSDAPENYAAYLESGPYKTDRLFVKGFKLYGDGALGSRGACLLRHYSDKPGWYGFLLSPPTHFDSIARILINTDFQMCTHAIGDSGNRTVLNTYARYLQGKNGRRWRIEHAQVVNEQDFYLFGANSIVPSVQPTHATSDMYWASERLGADRMKGAYAYQQLLQQNGWLPLGTDFPVEDISPFKTFLAAVVRKDAAGYPADGFQVQDALTREQALRGMTIWAAKAGFLENEVGSLEPGKKADFIILDNDLMTAGEKQILNTRVVATFVGGQKVK